MPPPTSVLLSQLFIAVHYACLLALTITIEHQFKPSGVSFFCCDAPACYPVFPVCFTQ